MISFCKNCKFWNEAKYDWASKQSSFDHRCKEMENGASGLIFLDAYEQEGFYTKPDFGCVLFQPL